MTRPARVARFPGPIFSTMRKAQVSEVPTLSDLYDADQRTRDPKIRELAHTSFIPHPLNNVAYTDGVSVCRHVRKHDRFQPCRQEVRRS